MTRELFENNETEDKHSSACPALCRVPKGVLPLVVLFPEFLHETENFCGEPGLVRVILNGTGVGNGQIDQGACAEAKVSLLQLLELANVSKTFSGKFLTIQPIHRHRWEGTFCSKPQVAAGTNVGGRRSS